jgi:adenylyltransferase/sulfurtransferase
VGGEAATLCGQRAVQVTPGAEHRVDLHALAGRLGAVGEVTEHPFMLRCRLAAESADGEGCLELTVFRDGRAIVRGTGEPVRARSVYAKYIGA